MLLHRTDQEDCTSARSPGQVDRTTRSPTDHQNRSVCRHPARVICGRTISRRRRPSRKRWTNE